MLDVHLPATDGREIVLSRYTQPERDVSVIGAPEVDVPGASASENLQSRQRLEFEDRVVPTF
jgi:hypothetical protein